MANEDSQSASRSASKCASRPLRCEKMSFRRRSEAVGTLSRVPGVSLEASSELIRYIS